jgi:BirA family transcriptional regulator, biotin operon repressor / biotin---[acetyl-CoA-carboxylase] ligase
VHHCLLSTGIDVNVPIKKFSTALQDQVTSICAEVGHEVDRASFLARILNEFESHYHLLESGEYDAILREWKSLSCTLDTRVQIRTLKNSFEGEAIDIDEFGALIIRKDNGKIERVIAGDCFHRQ